MHTMRVAVFFGLALSSASASANSDLEQCVSRVVSPSERVVACTRALDRGLPAAQFNTAYLLRGFAFEQLGDLESAIDDYSEAVEFDPGEARQCDRRGSLSSTRLIDHSRGSFDEAALDYVEVLKLNPGNQIAKEKLSKATIGSDYAAFTMEVARIEAAREARGARSEGPPSEDQAALPPSGVGMRDAGTQSSCEADAVASLSQQDTTFLLEEFWLRIRDEHTF